MTARGGGHALRQGFPFAAGDWRDNLLGVFLFDYPDRRETMAMVEQFFERAQVSLTAPPGGKSTESVSHGEEKVAFGNMLLSLLPPAFEQVDRQTWALKTHEAAAIVAVAILSYKSDRGEYPAGLETLVATGNLSKLPLDPYANGPLSYRRTNGSFLLYSWGENLTDDGGVQGLGQEGQPRMWADNGDWSSGPSSAPGNSRFVPADSAPNVPVTLSACSCWSVSQHRKAPAETLIRHEEISVPCEAGRV